LFSFIGKKWVISQPIASWTSNQVHFNGYANSQIWVGDGNHFFASNFLEIQDDIGNSIDLSNLTWNVYTSESSSNFYAFDLDAKVWLQSTQVRLSIATAFAKKEWKQRCNGNDFTFPIGSVAYFVNIENWPLNNSTKTTITMKTEKKDLDDTTRFNAMNSVLQTSIDYFQINFSSNSFVAQEIFQTKMAINNELSNVLININGGSQLNITVPSFTSLEYCSYFYLPSLSQPDQTSDSSVSEGTILAIVFGSVLLGLALIVLCGCSVYYLMRKHTVSETEFKEKANLVEVSSDTITSL